MENKKSKIGIYDECFSGVVFDEVPNGSTCLDVGCWTGNLGKSLVDKKKCVVDGIDFNQDALNEARRRGYREVYSVNFNNENFDLNINNNYDIIICADVLEHLSSPGMVLEKLKSLLKDDGQIIISIPNIAFIQQRLMLLTGKFSYNPVGGIMDETHLRFFTFESIKQLCLKSGYEITKYYGYNQVKNKFFFLRLLAKVYPSLFAIQFLLKLKKCKQ